METRSLGSLKLPLAGLGCANFGWWIDEARAREVVYAALDTGVSHFDTADEYGEGQSEEFLGRALGSARERVIITTKFAGAKPPDGIKPGSAAWVRRSCEASLKRLRTDWIDLYLMHHPDPSTPIGETLEALRDLKKAGKVREIGCSNVSLEQLADAADAAAKLGFAGYRTVQCGYSLLDRTAENALIPQCTALSMPIIPYFPLASGMLIGKYRRSQPSPAQGRMELDLHGTKVRDYFPALFTSQCFDVVEALEQWALARGKSLRELALAWVASKPWVASVISGATSAEQLQENATALSDWRLTEAEQAEVEGITTTEYAFTWLRGSPSYSQPPPWVGIQSAPSPR